MERGDHGEESTKGEKTAGKQKRLSKRSRKKWYDYSTSEELG